MKETVLTAYDLGDPRLAAQAADAAPVWIWSSDGARVLWANPAGCAAFGAESLSALTARSFESAEPVRLQVAWLAATLPPGGMSRLERLHGFVPHGSHPFRRPLPCECALVTTDQGVAVLVMAMESPRPPLSLDDRFPRLAGENDEALAAISQAIAAARAIPEAQNIVHFPVATVSVDAGANPQLPAATRAPGVDEAFDELRRELSVRPGSTGWVAGTADASDQPRADLLIGAAHAGEAGDPAGSGSGAAAAAAVEVPDGSDRRLDPSPPPAFGADAPDPVSPCPSSAGDNAEHSSLSSSLGALDGSSQNGSAALRYSLDSTTGPSLEGAGAQNSWTGSEGTFAEPRLASGANAGSPAAIAETDETPAVADVRATLRSILGLCDIILEERFGPLGDGRYRDYVADIRKAGAQSLSSLNGTADPECADAGLVRDASPGAVNLNSVVHGCIGHLQAPAEAARVILRLSLSAALPAVGDVPDVVRQMVESLLGHALKTSRPGGQLIVSTGLAASGGPMLRVRNEGYGIAARDASVQASADAIVPSWYWPDEMAPLTGALAAASRGRLKITAGPHQGCLFELSFAGIASE